MSKTITIAGPKGGTGKSITAVNLASSLALFEQKILLIDCDPQGCSTQWCGVKPEQHSADITSVLSGRSKVADALVKTGIAHLDIMPAGFNLFHAALKLGRNPGNEKILRLFLNDIKDEYDYIIVDAPSSYSFLTISAMVAADSVLICMVPDHNTYGDFHSLLRMVKYIRSTHEVQLKIAGILFNRCKTEQQIQSFLEEQGLLDVQEMVFKTFIPDDEQVKVSRELATPCALHDINSTAAQAYLDFAKEIHFFFK